MNNEFKIFKNEFSIFKIFCYSCGKLLKILDNSNKDDDKLIVSKNCSHIICQQCLKNNKCPLCQKTIEEIENIEALEDQEKKEFLITLAEKFYKISETKDLLKNVNCGKNLVGNCTSKNDNLCRTCFDENSHSDHVEEGICNQCIEQFECSLYCVRCAPRHTHRTHHTMISIVDDLQYDLQINCEENIKILDTNIENVDVYILEIDDLIKNLKSNSKIVEEKVKKEYLVIEKNYNQKSGEILRKIGELNQTEMEFIEINKSKLKKIQNEIENLGEKMKKVEDVHNYKHYKSRVYLNNLAEDLWNNKYIEIRDNNKNIINILSQNEPWKQYNFLSNYLFVKFISFLSYQFEEVKHKFIFLDA